jgi:hypothetical protein
MFWLAEDGEPFGQSVEDLFDDFGDSDEVEIRTASRVPNFWSRIKAVSASLDYDVIDDSEAVRNG